MKAQKGKPIPEIVTESYKLGNGEKKTRQYRIGNKLGEGAFATCYEITDMEKNIKYACKLVVKASLGRTHSKQKLMNEIKVHRSLNNQYVCRIVHFFDDDDNIYIILELCAEGTLESLLKVRKRLHTLEVQFFTYHIAKTLQYFLSEKVIHRDLKLGNLLLNHHLDLKIVDFGLAVRLESIDELRKTICGTPNYIAPEVIQGHVGHSFGADIWSLGVIIY